MSLAETSVIILIIILKYKTFNSDQSSFIDKILDIALIDPETDQDLYGNTM
jgi:hypothetical protein